MYGVLTAEWSVEKSVPSGVLIWRLVAGSNPPGDSSRIAKLPSWMRLAMRSIPPGGSESNSGVCSVGAWWWGLTRQAVAVKSACFEALCAWRYATPPGGLGAGSAWRHVSPARRFVLLQLGIWLCNCDLQGV